MSNQSTTSFPSSTLPPTTPVNLELPQLQRQRPTCDCGLRTLHRMSASTFCLGAAGWLCSACSNQVFQLAVMRVNGRMIQVFRHLDRHRSPTGTEPFALFGSLNPPGSLFGIPLHLVPPQPNLAQQVINLPTHPRFLELPLALRPFCAEIPPPLSLPLRSFDGPAYLPQRTVATSSIRDPSLPTGPGIPCPLAPFSASALNLGPRSRIATPPMMPPAEQPVHATIPPPQHLLTPHSTSAPFAVPSYHTRAEHPVDFSTTMPANSLADTPTTQSAFTQSDRSAFVAPIRLRRAYVPSPYHLRSPAREIYERVTPSVFDLAPRPQPTPNNSPVPSPPTLTLDS